MAFTQTGTLRTYLPCQHPEGFTHKPIRKGKNAIKPVFVHPHLHKEFWTNMWATIQAQPWYEQDVGMVMVGDDGFAYCQYPGQTTGLARVYVGLPA